MEDGGLAGGFGVDVYYGGFIAFYAQLMRMTVPAELCLDSICFVLGSFFFGFALAETDDGCYYLFNRLITGYPYFTSSSFFLVDWLNL